MDTPLMVGDMYANQSVVVGSEAHQIDGLPILDGYEQWIPRVHQSIKIIYQYLK